MKKPGCLSAALPCFLPAFHFAETLLCSVRAVARTQKREEAFIHDEPAAVRFTDRCDALQHLRADDIAIRIVRITEENHGAGRRRFDGPDEAGFHRRRERKIRRLRQINRDDLRPHALRGDTVLREGRCRDDDLLRAKHLHQTVDQIRRPIPEADPLWHDRVRPARACFMRFDFLWRRNSHCCACRRARSRTVCPHPDGWNTDVCIGPGRRKVRSKLPVQKRNDGVAELLHLPVRIGSALVDAVLRRCTRPWRHAQRIDIDRIIEINCAAIHITAMYIIHKPYFLCR